MNILQHYTKLTGIHTHTNTNTNTNTPIHLAYIHTQFCTLAILGGHKQFCCYKMRTKSIHNSSIVSWKSIKIVKKHSKDGSGLRFHQSFVEISTAMWRSWINSALRVVATRAVELSFWRPLRGECIAVAARSRGSTAPIFKSGCYAALKLQPMLERRLRSSLRQRQRQRPKLLPTH